MAGDCLAAVADDDDRGEIISLCSPQSLIVVTFRTHSHTSGLCLLLMPPEWIIPESGFHYYHLHNRL